MLALVRSHIVRHPLLVRTVDRRQHTGYTIAEEEEIVASLCFSLVHRVV